MRGTACTVFPFSVVTHRAISIISTHDSILLGAQRNGVLFTSKRYFGNAPARIRPREVPMEHPFRQSEREVSASVVIAVMFMVPMWFFVISAEREEWKRAEVEQWALEKQALHGGEVVTVKPQ